MSLSIILVLGSTILISLLAFSDRERMNILRFSPYAVKHAGQWYRFLTSGFVHANYAHLGMNMLVLYFFSDAIMVSFTNRFPSYSSDVLFILMYVLALVVSGLPAMMRHKDNAHYAAVGASGAVSAVVFATILLNPLGEMGLLLIPIRIKSFLFGFLYLLGEAVLAKRGRTNIGHEAHMAGAAFGITFLIVLDWHVLPEFLDAIAMWFNSFF